MANVWTQFQKLLPSKLMQSGTVTAFDTTSCTVELPDGKSVKVLLAGHTVAVGDHVFIRGGEVVGEAPSLTVYEVTV
jgi:hypothetical protein